MNWRGIDFGTQQKKVDIDISAANISISFAMSVSTNGPGSSVRKAVGPRAKVTVVLGAQWGDEGKGKLVDILATSADIVCRCQVCNNVVTCDQGFFSLTV